MKYILFLLSFVLLTGVNEECLSQCCSAGNPSCVNNPTSGGNSNTLDVSVLYMHSYSDTYYSGSQKSDFKYIKDLNFDFSSLYLAYSITDNLRITSEVGFFYDKLQHFDFGPEQKFTRLANGIGDAAIGAAYKFGLDNLLLDISPMAKVTLPFGKFDQKNGSVVLPIDIQPSSGNFKYELGLTLAKRFENSKFSMFGFSSFEMPQRIITERTNYKYGNQLNLSLIGAYGFTDYLTGLLQFRGMFKAKASNDKLQLIESTGGTIVFVSPQVVFNVFSIVNIGLQLDYPVYFNLNGIQLANKYSYQAKFSRSFNFTSSKKMKVNDEENEEIETKTISKAEFQVDGLCDMCKERIENTVKELRNVVTASWNKETKILRIGYNTQPDIDGIKKAIADAGHDNETYKANDAAYSKLPSCCKYRDKSKQTHH